MGTYYYSLRAKKVKAKDKVLGPNGGSIEIALMSYAYGNGYDYYNPKHRFLIDNVDRHSVNAWDKHEVNGKVPYVAVGDKFKEGMHVYRNGTSRGWSDCDNFPAEGAHGYLVKEGNRWAVVTTYEENTNGVVYFETPVPYVGHRLGIKDNAHVELGYYIEMPNSCVDYVPVGDKEAREKVVAVWKPINDAKVEAQRVADNKAKAERQRKLEEAKKKALQEERAELAKKMAEIDLSINKLAHA